MRPSRVPELHVRGVPQGTVFSGREKTAYKCTGSNSRQISNYDIYSISERRYYNTPSDLYHDSPVVFIENGGRGAKIPQLFTTSKKIWAYLARQKITITAEYIPNSVNLEGDRKSRQTKNFSGWRLKSKIFGKECQAKGTP